MEPFKLSCPCDEHDFVFAYPPWCNVEVRCPKCGEELTYDPEQEKEDDK